MKETEWQDLIMRSARASRWLAYHVYDSRKSAAGFPDCILVRPPRIVAAELKTETGAVTKEQAKWLAAFAASGAETYVWRPSDWREVERVLR